MSIKDTIKSSVLDALGRSAGLRLWEILLILAAACAIGAYIFLVYKGFSKSAFYSRDLNVTLAGMCVTVAAIMIAMQTNLLVSLGMVGALSIVRFRTAIKNPLDLLYLFWSISAGIICGVGLYTLAILLCAIMTALIWLLGSVPASRAPAVLIVKADAGADEARIHDAIKRESAWLHLSSVVTRAQEAEWIYEVRAKDKGALTRSVSRIEGVTSVSCLESDSEIRA